MPHGWTLTMLLLAGSCSFSVTSPWYRYVYQEYQAPAGSHYDHHPQECDHHYDHRHEEGARRGEYGGYYEQQQKGCACLLFVESTLVSRSENNSLWNSCDGWGLNQCGQHCDQLFQDVNTRFRILQNACDTLGREVVSPLYRRHQVCGQYGPYEDYLLPDDLCCRRGRPSDTC